MSGIKVSRIKSKETRRAIINNHLETYKEAKEYDEAVKELHDKLFGGRDEEKRQLEELREQYQTETNPAKKQAIVNRIKDDFGEIVSLEQDFQDGAKAILDKESQVSLTKIDQDDFLSAAVDAECDITNADLITLQEMFND